MVRSGIADDWAYLGQVLFILALLESITIEVCSLIGYLSNDGIFHLVCRVSQRS